MSAIGRSRPALAVSSLRDRLPLELVRQAATPRTIRILRILAAISWVGILFAGIAVFGINPAAPGGDSWNYLAAGERLNAGHPLYALVPGDRPVPIVPPYWTVPLLSPPLIAVIWRPLALLGEPAMTLWWIGGAASIFWFAYSVLRYGEPLAILGLIALSPALVFTALSGNAAAYLVPLLASRHPCGGRFGRRGQGVAGPSGTVGRSSTNPGLDRGVGAHQPHRRWPSKSPRLAAWCGELRAEPALSGEPDRYLAAVDRRSDGAARPEKLALGRHRDDAGHSRRLLHDAEPAGCGAAQAVPNARSATLSLSKPPTSPTEASAVDGVPKPHVTRSSVAQRALSIWFLAWSAVRVIQLGWTGQAWDLSFIGRDFWIYRNAAVAVLDGTDPWAASSRWNGTDWHFAAAPPAAQLFTPFALIDPGLGLALFIALSAVAALVALRRLGLPAWWLLFPPMTEGLIAANPQILVFGLLVISLTGGGPLARGSNRVANWTTSLARGVAVGLKVYAIAPIAARREGRAIVGAAALLALSIVLGPGLWQQYATDFGGVSSRLVAESQGGLSAALFLRPEIFPGAVAGNAQLLGLALYGLVAGLVLLAAVRDVEGAGWVVAPLLLPGAEYHLATMAIPAARRLAIWIIAVPTVPTYLLGLIVLTYEITAGRPALAGPRTDPTPLRAWLASLRSGSGRRGPTDGEPA